METKTFATGAVRRRGRRGTPLAIAGMLALAIGQPAVGEEVYKCRDKGRVVYTSEPTLPSCQIIHLDVRQPDPKALARLARERQQEFAKELEAEKRLQNERLVRARQWEAEAQLRLARAAEITAQAALNCPAYAFPSYYSAPIYAGPYFSSYSDRYLNRRDDYYDHYRMNVPSTARLTLSPTNLSYRSGYYRALRDDYYRRSAPVFTDPGATLPDW